MRLKDLCDRAGILCPASEGEREIRAIVTDSRRVTNECMYICIKGFHFDGHRFAEEAAKKGAVCILAQTGESVPALSGAVRLYTEDTRRATARLFDVWYGFPSRQLKIVGVTGTNGKTTVTHMLRHILESNLCRCGLIGTVGCDSVGRHLEGSTNPLANMTTPDPEDLYRMLAEMVQDGVEYVLMEVTSHALALGKLDPICFEAAIFTNLTPEHLDFHGTMDAYADAKAELFEKSRLGVVNLDSPYAERMLRKSTGRTVTCSSEGKDATYCADSIEVSGNCGVFYRLSSKNSNLKIQCPVPGSFTVTNSMQAAVCALELGFGAGQIKDALSSLSGVKGRMERVRLGLGANFTVLIDYAHTPDALENLLRTAHDMREKGQRLVVLFGCGGDRDRGKRPVMGSLASRYADFVIVTSDNSRGEDPEEIIKEILSGMDPSRPHTVICDRRAAIRHAILEAEEGDLILLAGKGHEEYEITGEGKKPFFEKQIVADAFYERVRHGNKNDSTEGEG